MVPKRISKDLFLAGILAAVLILSLASTLASMASSVGPRGEQETEGLETAQKQQDIQRPPGSQEVADPTEALGSNEGLETQRPEGMQGINMFQTPNEDTGPQVVQEPIGNFTIDDIAGWVPAPTYDSGFGRANQTWYFVDYLGQPAVEIPLEDETALMVGVDMNAQFPTMVWKVAEQ